MKYLMNIMMVLMSTSTYSANFFIDLVPADVIANTPKPSFEQQQRIEFERRQKILNSNVLEDRIWRAKKNDKPDAAQIKELTDQLRSFQ